MSDPTWPGHCWKCGTPVREIVSTFPSWHSLAGRPLQFGKVNDDCRLVSFVLADGATIRLDFCSSCAAALAPEDLPLIWRRVMESECFALRNRAALRARPLPPGQAEKAFADLAKRATTVPLGIQCVQSWKDLMTAENIRKAVA